MDKNKGKILLIVMAVCVCGVIWVISEKNPSNMIQQDEEQTQNESMNQVEDGEDNKSIFIHIIGAIKKPGVYTFDKKPRVIDVVKKAGGFTKHAVKDAVNQAKLVEDGTQLEIASDKDKKDKTESGSSDSNLLNINTAEKEELMTLAGIGESKALSIIEYRETKGKFKKIEDIMNITGIKEGVFNKLKNQIQV